MNKMQCFGDDFSAEEIKKIEHPRKERTHVQYQDSSFKALFSEEKYQRLFLKEYCDGIDYENVVLENIELNQIFTIDVHNDVCFLADNTLVVLMEHQSSINCNMPLRLLLYVAEEYKRLFQVNGRAKQLLTKDRVIVPRPVFCVVYTGIEEWDVHELKLSDSFPEGEKYLELTVPVYTKDSSHGIIQEYTDFIGFIKEENTQGLPLIDAIRIAINKYSSGYEISDFLREKEDIMDLVSGQFTDEEWHRAQIEAEAENAAKKAAKKAAEEEITKAIKDNYKSLITAGISREEALQITADIKGLTIQEVKAYLIK